MSLCFFIQDKHQIFFGSDSAITLNGKRSTQHIQKVMPLPGGGALFVTGTVNCLAAAQRQLTGLPNVEPEDVQRFMREQYKVELELNPDYESDSRKDLLSAVMFKVGSDNIARSYSMGSTSNFDIIPSIEENGVFLSAAGYDAKKAYDEGIRLCAAGPIDPVAIMRKVFEYVSGAQIGGFLTVHHMDSTGIKFVSYEKIRETLQFEVTDEPLLKLHGYMVASEFLGGVIKGSYITTSDTSYPRAEMSDTLNLFRASSSPTNYAEIAAVGINYAPELHFTNGTRRVRCGVSVGGTFADSALYSSDDLEIAAPIVWFTNSVRVRDWSYLSTIGGQTLAATLSGKADKSSFYGSVEINGVTLHISAGVIVNVT